MILRALSCSFFVVCGEVSNRLPRNYVAPSVTFLVWPSPVLKERYLFFTSYPYIKHPWDTFVCSYLQACHCTCSSYPEECFHVRFLMMKELWDHLQILSPYEARKSLVGRSECYCCLEDYMREEGTTSLCHSLWSIWSDWGSHLLWHYLFYTS